MISILAQERLLGAALGSSLIGVVVFEQRRTIYNSISEFHSQFSPQSKITEPVISKKPRLELGHLWNQAVDQTLGSLIKSLSSRGW
ncbi:hypothetical protein LIER_10430 [Lithospermum erythrorhizon]|uniref:Uncharacterized protein n=1 Tax=Lithospermum erythrorhizon TaxID=34254 RepID=A0AAV3PKP8_LITER